MGNSVGFVDIPSMERTPQAAHTYSEYETEPVRSSNPVGDTNMPEPAVIFIIHPMMWLRSQEIQNVPSYFWVIFGHQSRDPCSKA